MIFARKINKIAECYIIFARKRPNITIIIAQKYCPELFGVGQVPLLCPVSYAYGEASRNWEWEEWTKC